MAQLLDLASPNFMYSGTAVKNNQMVVVNIPNPIKVSQKQTTIYQSFNINIKPSHIFDGSLADVRLHKDDYRMCPLFWEDLVSSFPTIQTILIVTGTSPKLLKLQEYPIGCLDIEEKTIKNIYCDKYIATLLHTFFENFR